MSHVDLLSYYRLLFELTQIPDSNYTITEIESLMPFERDIYVGLLQRAIEERKEE